MLKTSKARFTRAKRASHIDPPASSYAIMRRGIGPTAERILDPVRMFTQSLTPGPEIRERPRPEADGRAVEHIFRATNKERDALQLTCQLPMASRLVADPTRWPLANELTGQIEPSVRKVVSLLLRLGH